MNCGEVFQTKSALQAHQTYACQPTSPSYTEKDADSTEHGSFRYEFQNARTVASRFNRSYLDSKTKISLLTEKTTTQQQTKQNNNNNNIVLDATFGRDHLKQAATLKKRRRLICVCTVDDVPKLFIKPLGVSFVALWIRLGELSRFGVTRFPEV